MKTIFARWQGARAQHLGFFLLAVLLLWAKTYAAYHVEFNLGIDNSLQKFLLLINPLSSAMLFLGLALFSSGKRVYKWIIGLDLVMSILLYANILYYRFFTDFITLPTLTQTTSNAGDLGESITALLNIYDPLYFLDCAILIFLVMFKKVKPVETRMKKRTVLTVFAVGLFFLVSNVGLAEKDRPELLTRTFDRNYLVKYLGMYNYTIYDAIQSTKSFSQRAMSDSSDVTEVINYTKATYAEPNKDYFGVAKGKNVIYIHLESVQNFLVDYKLNGEEVTPFLNSMTKDSNSLYFDNFFHQTGQGKTADAEFMLENSLFGLSQGAAFTSRGRNTYQSAPAILGQQGYSSAVFHGNYKSFWNRDEIYKSFGFNNFFDANYYNMNDEDVLNYGLKDKPFFEESKALLETLPQPFYAKFIMLSNHFPFPISDEEATIAPHTTGDASVDRYFQTARYSDEALESFFDYLKETGLYDNSIIVMYGDHYGISDNHNEAMSKVLGYEVGSFENAQLQRVPLLIHTPGVEGGTMHQYGGQIDLLPTLLHLMGIDTKDYIQFGTDLLSENHQEVVAFRSGDFVSPSISAVNGKYYQTETGELVGKTDEVKQLEELVDMKLNLSDKVVNGDLLRFHTPAGFKPIKPSDYSYKYTEPEVKVEPESVEQPGDLEISN